jgi:ankyrin repeat protein
MNKLDELLIDVARHGSAADVKAVLAKGANPNAQDLSGNTPLQMAAIYGNVEAAEVLIEAKAQVNLANKYGNSPLMWAAGNGHTELVKFLIQNKADVNAKNNEGKTAMDRCYFYQRDKMIALLSKHGATIHPSKMGRNAPSESWSPFPSSKG